MDMDNESNEISETIEAVNSQPAPVAGETTETVDTRRPLNVSKLESFFRRYPEAEELVLERRGLTGAVERLQALEIKAARGEAITEFGLTAEEAKDLPGADSASILAAAAYAAKIKAQYAGSAATPAKPETTAKPQPVEAPPPPERKAPKVSSVEDAIAAIRSA